MQFLHNLESLMAEKNMNKSDLARACGLSTSTVNSWWNRSCENIALPTIMKIARYFNVTIEELVNAPAQKDEDTCLDFIGKNIQLWHNNFFT